MQGIKDTEMKYPQIATGVLIGAAGIAVTGCNKGTTELNITEYKTMIERPVEHFDQVIALFPKTVDEVQAYKRKAIEKAQQDVQVLIALPAHQRTYANTVAALDNAQDAFGKMASIIRTLEMVSPNNEIRMACHEAVIELSKFAVDTFVTKDLYRAHKEYCDSARRQEYLSEEQSYMLDESMKAFKRSGFDLPDDKFEKIRTINKKLGELEVIFESNIANDKSFIAVAKEDLAGLSDEFINELERDGEKYKVTCDYPVYNEVRSHCTVEQTRKALYQAFNNRAYPVNMPILKDIVQERYNLARILGFASYAALNLDSLMAQTPERAHDFITKLAQQAHKKMKQEMQQFGSNLPEGVTLVDGKFKPWDLEFIKNAYKKKHFSIDEREVAQYFEVEKTINAIFDIYQRFLGLKFFMTKPSWAWHEDARVIEVRENASGILRGYVILDLHPRLHKYSHACWMQFISARRYRNEDGTWHYTPAVGSMIANFPKATKNAPALMKHNDVETFFHEFGHAMHAVLGATEYASTSGTSVKQDFVETPSQMFEEWMFDPQVLRSISSHYKTRASLPDDIINKIIGLKKFDSGYFVVRQCILSLIPLAIFKDGDISAIDELVEKLNATYMPEVIYDRNNHFIASFGHLGGYGAAYYSYMWAKVFALDLFYEIKKRGINNVEVGKSLIQTVLGRGGSANPDVLLKAFLGRKPNQEAFTTDLGFDG